MFLHAIFTFLLTGLIWVIQLVHYPLFRFLDSTSFSKAMLFHQRQISFIVMPLMLAELITGIYLAISQWQAFTSFHIINLSLIAIIWAHTFFIMVPFHRSFETSFDEMQLKKMLRVHWLRTLAWTIKSILWAATIWHILSIY